MKKLIVGAAALFVVALPVSAATMRAGNDYMLGQNQTVPDNLYAAASNLTLSGVVFGDALVAGRTVLLNGLVKDDVAAAGGTVQLLSTVNGDARVAGGDVTIGGKIAGDLIVAGGTVHVLQSAVIGGDVVMLGGALTFDGVALKDVRMIGGSALIHGLITGSLRANVSKTVTVATGASIKGNFDYAAPTPATVEKGAIIGGKITATTTPAAPSETQAIFATLVSIALLTKFIILALAAALLVYFFPRASSSVTMKTLAEIPKNTILGFTALVVIPIASVLLMATVLFFPFGILVLILYAFLLGLSKLYVGVVAGALLSKWFVKREGVNVGFAILGTAAIELASLIPIVGWIVSAVFCLATFGAIMRILSARYGAQR